MVSNGPKGCGQAGYAVYVKIIHYLEWIGRIRIHDLTEEFIRTNAVPYEKMDSDAFKAMFRFLKINVEDILV